MHSIEAIAWLARATAVVHEILLRLLAMILSRVIRGVRVTVYRVRMMSAACIARKLDICSEDGRPEGMLSTRMDGDSGVRRLLTCRWLIRIDVSLRTIVSRRTVLIRHISLCLRVCLLLWSRKLNTLGWLLNEVMVLLGACSSLLKQLLLIV